VPEGGVRRRWRVGKRQDQTLLTCQCLAVQQLLGTSYCSACVGLAAAGALGFSGAGAGQLDVLGHSSVHAPCACSAGTLPGQTLDVQSGRSQRPGPEASGEAEEAQLWAVLGRTTLPWRQAAGASAQAVRTYATATGATPAKQSWLPGLPIPPYLEDLPAAYGFDPLRLGSNKGALRWCAPPASHPLSHALAESPARLAWLQAARGWSGGAPPICPRLLGTDAPHARDGGRTCQEPGSVSSCLGTHLHLRRRELRGLSLFKSALAAPALGKDGPCQPSGRIARLLSWRS